MQLPTIRRIQIGDWIYEVKAVRAIRASSYGQAYDACASFTFNGNSCYIEGQMTRDDSPFTSQDYASFYQLCQMMEVDEAHYDRYQNGQRRSRRVKIHGGEPSSPEVLPFANKRSA
ncbi:hypothetical protein [Aliagarivorans taiwanensis]|uniref:hypothetical protein n=1 Tax=Aliagarivorans taiwanensis TaxID=561966 RepID=UPI00042791F4|nr:hypothetical protein [Aliagarivorans taiwanensis]